MVINLLVIFSFGTSLLEWKKKGLLEREISIYKRFSKEGVNIGFLSYGNDSDLKLIKKKNNFNVFPIRSHYKGKIIPVITPLLMVLVNKKYFRNFDIVKSNQMTGSSFLWFIKYFYQKRVILRCGYEKFKNEVYIFKNFRKSLFKLFYLCFLYVYEWISYHTCDHIVFSNDYDKNYAINLFKIDSKKVSVIPNYVDMNIFKPNNMPKKENSSIFVGNLNLFKNLENLINAFKILKGFSLSVVGSGELKAGLIKKVKENNLENTIVFLGRIPNEELPSIYNEHELFILPSFTEGNPKALLEAMSCGVICIGSNVKGINNVIKHNINGYLCETDSESISNVIKFAYSNSTKNDMIVRNALDYIKNHHSIEVICKKELRLYHQILLSKKLKQDS